MCPATFEPQQTIKAGRVYDKFTDSEAIRIREKQNELVDNLLVEHNQNNLIHSDSRINNIAEYITSDNQNEKVAEVARRLLTPAGLYGSGYEDDFTYNKNTMVIAEYLTNLTLGMPVDKWIIKDSMHLLKNGHNAIHGDLVRDYFNNINDPNKNISTKARIFIHENLLKRKFPIFSLNTHRDELDKLNKISIFSPRWGMIHAGAMFLSEIDTTLDDYNLEAIHDVGVVLFNLIQEGGVPLEFLSYFRLPALMYYFHSMRNLSFDDSGDGSDVFINYNNIVKEWFESNDPIFLLSKSVKEWKARTQLAQELLNSKNITAYSTVDYLNSHDEVDIEGADGNIYTFPNIDVKFEKQNKNIGTLFSMVQKLHLSGVFNELPEHEQSFIVNSRVNRIKFEFNGQSMVRGKINIGRSGIAQNKVLRYSLPDDRDFIQCINGEEERIYSLEVSQGAGRYTMRRVDRDRNILLFYLDAALPVGSKNYELKLFNEQVLKEKDEQSEMLIDNIVSLQQKRLISYLHNKGYDKTKKEKISEFLLGLIPFYTCVTEGWDGDPEQAIPSCIIDVASLLPFLYSVAKVGMRFSFSLGNASVQAMKYGLLKSTLRASVNEAGKVLVQEFPSMAQTISPAVVRALSVNLARSVDPGFGLLFFAGKKGLLKLKDYFKKLEKKGIFQEKLASSIDKKITSMTSKTEIHMQKKFWCPVYNENMEVYRIGMEGNREVWARFNHETQVFFGEKFVREAGKEIRPLSNLARENVPIKIAFDSLEELNEDLLFRRTNDGYMLSNELADRIIDDAESVSEPVSFLSNAEQEQNLIINLEGRVFRAIAADEQIYKLSNRLKGEKDIFIYKYDELLFELKAGTDTITHKCIVKRSPSDTAGPSRPNVCDVIIEDYVKTCLKPQFRANVDESSLSVYNNFPYTFIKKNKKLYFKCEGNYFKARFRPKRVFGLQQDMLTIYFTERTYFFCRNITLAKVVACDADGSIVIKSDVGLITDKTGISTHRASGMTSAAVRWKELDEIIETISKSNNLVDVPYPKTKPGIISDEYIEEEITKCFFHKSPQWETATMIEALGSGLFYLRSSAVALRNHHDFAIDNLRIAIEYLSAVDKPKQLNFYLSSVLNTDNKEIIERFAEQLSSRYKEIQSNLQNAQLVLCYSGKDPISCIDPETDYLRDLNILLSEEQNTPWEEVYWRPNQNEEQVIRGTFAMTFPIGDVHNRIWVNLDKLYFTDPTHPIRYLRKTPAIKQFLVLIHEASHQKDLAEDIIYIPFEDGDYKAVLDALDYFSECIEIKAVATDKLEWLATAYFSKRVEYNKMALEYLLSPPTLSHIFKHDPNFRSILLKGIPDLLALMAKDINNIYNLKLTD